MRKNLLAHRRVFFIIWRLFLTDLICEKVTKSSMARELLKCRALPAGSMGTLWGKL